MLRMKYIVLKTEECKELPFMFSADITHADFLDGVRCTPVGMWKSSGRNWDRSLMLAKCIAGGFFNGATCYGESESIGVKSRGDTDTALFLGGKSVH